MEDTKKGEFVIFIKGAQTNFIYCRYDPFDKVKEHCSVIPFPHKTPIDVSDFVKFTDGLYIIGFSKRAFYATYNFKHWYKYDIYNYYQKPEGCTPRMYLGKLKGNEALFI